MSGYRGRVTDLRQAGPRVLRATTLAAVTVALALGAHLLSGGERPSGWTLVQATLLLAVLMGLLPARQRPLTLVLALGGSQLVLHQWFSLATPGECAGHLATQYVPGLHLLPASVLPWGLLEQTARACATTGDAGATVLAIAAVAHALAALLTAALLTRGELLLSCAVSLVAPSLPAALMVVRRLATAVCRELRVRPGAAPRRHATRRGPPAVPLAA